MFVFVCAGCGAALTAPLSQVDLPVHARQSFGNGLQLPVLMEPGTFAVDPEPWGLDNPPGEVVIAPGEAHGTVLVPENRGSGYCCGLDGAGGPNMGCAACGRLVATRIDDCSLWQAVWLDPTAVRRLPVDGAEPAPLSWEELMAGEGTAPFELITRWGFRPGEEQWWATWSPQWEAAAGRALAHFLVASDGRAVTVPDGLPAEVFRRALDTLLPAGPPARRAVLAGPGLPAPDTDAGILLVPTHPQTGRTWTPVGPAASVSAYRVPLPFGVWKSMTFPEPYLPVPTSGRMPAGVLRDDYPPAPPRYRFPFRVDPGTFRATLVRLPAVRTPWLRAILDDPTRHRQAGIY
ncbi:hypothetical protein [Streptomyces sp. NPDC048623]|uniref:hypothetical protein n=1 Tax=Streptomyces sp. NPDC048623 TaxID=3155761 RepID=UPI0034454DAF